MPSIRCWGQGPAGYTQGSRESREGLPEEAPLMCPGGAHDTTGPRTQVGLGVVPCVRHGAARPRSMADDPENLDRGSLEAGSWGSQHSYLWAPGRVDGQAWLRSEWARLLCHRGRTGLAPRRPLQASPWGGLSFPGAG